MRNGAPEHAHAPDFPTQPTWRRSSPAPPLETYQAGDTVLAATSTTGRRLILKEAAVEVVKKCVEIAKVFCRIGVSLSIQNDSGLPQGLPGYTTAV